MIDGTQHPSGDLDSIPSVPLTFGAWCIGTLFRALPGGSVAKMSEAQVLKSQGRTLGHNPVTDLIFGGVRQECRLEDRSIPGPQGETTVRIYRPPTEPTAPLPLIMHFHGGGWVFGDLNLGDWICSSVSVDLPAIVVSVDYRRAPTDRFPAAVDDCYSALNWATEHAGELGADPKRIGVMGDSAGGNLAAVVCLTARDRGGPGIAHQSLIYPATDLSGTTASYDRNANAPILSTASMRAYRDLYLGPDGDSRDWRASPLLAPDHGGLPPALVILAGHDPLHDEGARYAETLRGDGVAVTVSEYPAMPHGFVGLPRFCRDAVPAVAHIVEEQRRAFSDVH